MVFLIAEKDQSLLQQEASLASQAMPGAKIITLSSADQVLDFIRSQPVGVALLGADLEQPDSLKLASRIRKLRPDLNLIFSAADQSLSSSAMSLHASGYLTRPFGLEQLREELRDLRYPISEDESGLFVQTFGDFEVFFNGRPVMFRYQKTKELFAYLIDRRGAVVESDTLITILWGGEVERSNYFKQIRKDLKDTLDRLGMSQCLIRRRGGMAIIPEWIPCDYFDWLKGLPSGIDAYRGEYMRQYDWAESTAVNLARPGTHHMRFHS